MTDTQFLNMKEEWLMSGAVVPVDVETTAALLVEIKRLIHVVGGMALEDVVLYHDDGTRIVRIAAKRPWVDLTDEEIQDCDPHEDCWHLFKIARAVLAKSKEKNT